MRFLQKTTTAAAALTISAFIATGASAGHHGDHHMDTKEGESTTGVYAPEKTDANPDNLNYTPPKDAPADAAKAIRKDSSGTMGDATIDAKSNLSVE